MFLPSCCLCGRSSAPSRRWIGTRTGESDTGERKETVEGRDPPKDARKWCRDVQGCSSKSGLGWMEKYIVVICARQTKMLDDPCIYARRMS